MRQQLRQGGVLFAVAAIVFLTRLGATRLWDDDETFFAQVAREMFERGDLIVPWFNQALFSHKPPLMYWMMIAAYTVFGVTEFAARLPSALFGMATVMLVWRLGRILYSPGVGFWAAIILATSLNFVVICRAATSDAELIFFCTLPIYLFVRGTATRQTGFGAPAGRLVWTAETSLREPTWGTYALVYAAMGMAVMVKGPIGLVLPAGVMGLSIVCRRFAVVGVADSAPETDGTSLFVLPAASAGERKTWSARFAGLRQMIASARIARTIWRMRPVTAIAMVLLVAGPWFVAVGLKTRGEFLAGFFGVHHFHRFTSPMDNHSGPAFYYLLAICVGFFPWIVFLGPSLVELRRRVREVHGWRPADILIASWFVVWVGFFSLASTKFPHYVVPAYPALALLTACFLERWTRDFAAYGKFARSAAWVTVAAAGLGILISIPFVARLYLDGEWFLGLSGLPLVAGAVVCAWFTERRQIVRALASLTATAVIFLVAVFAFAAVEVDRHQNAHQFAAAIRHQAPPGRAPREHARIAAWGYFRPGLVYYCNERIEQLADRGAATRFFDRSGPAFLVTTETEYRQMAGALPAGVEVLERGRWFLKASQALVLLGESGRGESAKQMMPSSAHSERDESRQ